MKREQTVKKPLKSRILPVAALIGFGFGLFSLGFAIGDDRLRITGSDLSSQNQALPADLDYSSVEQLYDLLRESFDGELKKNTLLDGLKAGLVSAADDPYTEYLNPEEAKEFSEQLSGSFTGIGAELGTDEDKNIIVVSPLSGYPAERAGLKAQDIIAAVDDQTTSGMTITQAVRQIRGPAGTKVTLTIVRGNEEPFELSITRDKITIASVESSVEGPIGYLKINQFSSDTASLAAAAARDFRRQNVKAVILDVRGNPGGFLDSAVDVASLWLNKGEPVVHERRDGETVRTERAGGNNLLKGLSTVVLIDEGSASASEIVAGALRDNEAATIVGAKSFGKGSIQRVEELRGGAELKVTIARWFTPDGKNIDKAGITPDIEVANPDTDSPPNVDPQRNRAEQILRARVSR